MIFIKAKGLGKAQYHTETTPHLFGHCEIGVLDLLLRRQPVDAEDLVVGAAGVGADILALRFNWKMLWHGSFSLNHHFDSKTVTFLSAVTTRLRLEVMGKIGKVGLKILTSSFMCLNDTSDTY